MERSQVPVGVVAPGAARLHRLRGAEGVLSRGTGRGRGHRHQQRGFHHQRMAHGADCARGGERGARPRRDRLLDARPDLSLRRRGGGGARGRRLRRQRRLHAVDPDAAEHPRERGLAAADRKGSSRESSKTASGSTTHSTRGGSSIRTHRPRSSSPRASCAHSISSVPRTGCASNCSASRRRG